MRPLVVGISGPSGAGKSTLATELREQVGDAVVLQQDWYFRDPSQCAPDANFCELRWLHIDELEHAAHALAAGHPATVPDVDMATFKRVGSRPLQPAPLLIIEGMTIFRIPSIDQLCRLRYYVDEDLDVIATRKRMRDKAERNKAPEIIEAQLSWIAAEHRNDYELRRRPDVTIVTSSAAAVIAGEVTKMRRLTRAAAGRPADAYGFIDSPPGN